MAAELERKADKAIVDEEYEQAVSLYTQAIKLDPSNASLYVSRAAGLIKLQAFLDAVTDANRAIELDPGLPKAHLRKGTAFFYLEEYQTAKAAFEAGAAVNPDNSQLKMRILECNAKLMEEAAGDRLHAPTAFSATASEVKEQNGSGVGAMPMDTANGATCDRQESAECSAPAPHQPKYRHEWYQTQNQAVVIIFAKNITLDQLKVEFGEQILSVVISRPEEEPYSLQLRLFGKVKVLESKYTVLNTKVEIRLAKAEAVQWKVLEYDPALISVQGGSVAVVAPKPASKKPVKNWDKLAAEDKDEKPEGDAALNKLFQDIYRDADPDTRRAMNKSFVESDGTVLSTNWKEVGSKHVEGSPPKGMERKKWEH